MGSTRNQNHKSRRKNESEEAHELVQEAQNKQNLSNNQPGQSWSKQKIVFVSPEMKASNKEIISQLAITQHAITQRKNTRITVRK